MQPITPLIQHFEHCSRADRISPHLFNSAQHNLFSSYKTLENICSLLGIVVGITVESQTIAALVNISKYSILSTVPGQIEFPLISPIVLSTIFSSYKTLENICSSLGIVMGITVVTNNSCLRKR